eukprot:1090086-Pyramimonas_sp.AAC.1
MLAQIVSHRLRQTNTDHFMTLKDMTNAFVSTSREPMDVSMEHHTLAEDTYSCKQRYQPSAVEITGSDGEVV